MTSKEISSHNSVYADNKYETVEWKRVTIVEVTTIT